MIHAVFMIRLRRRIQASCKGAIAISSLSQIRLSSATLSAGSSTVGSVMVRNGTVRADGLMVRRRKLRRAAKDDSRRKTRSIAFIRTRLSVSLR